MSNEDVESDPPEDTDGYTILRVGERLAMVTPLGQFFYLTSGPEEDTD